MTGGTYQQAWPRKSPPHSPRRSPIPWQMLPTASAEDAMTPYAVAGFGATIICCKVGLEGQGSPLP